MVSTAKHVSPDLFESDTPVRSTLVCGISRSPLDLRSPSLLHVLLTFMQARQQLSGYARALVSLESQGFLEDLLCSFCHEQSVSANRRT